MGRSDIPAKEDRVGSRYYIAGARYGYGAIDRVNLDNYEDTGSVEETVVAGITQKLAGSLAAQLNSAYRAGFIDGQAAPRKRVKKVV